MSQSSGEREKPIASGTDEMLTPGDIAREMIEGQPHLGICWKSVSGAACDCREPRIARLAKVLEASIASAVRGVKEDCAGAHSEETKWRVELETALSAALARAERAEQALGHAASGMALAYDAVSKGLYDEALLHLGTHEALARKVLGEPGTK